MPSKWNLRNERKNSVLMTHHCPDLVVRLIGWKFASTNQKYYPDLSSDASSVWNFCVRFSDVISRGNQWWRREMSAVYSGQKQSCFYSIVTFFFYRHWCSGKKYHRPDMHHPLTLIMPPPFPRIWGKGIWNCPAVIIKNNLHCWKLYPFHKWSQLLR